MPFRRAHYFLLPLFPLVLLAFWPGYFGMLRTAPFALHAHGIAATLWLVLVTAQCWTMNARRPVAHRTVGLLIFVLTPMFAAGSLLAIQGMVGLAVARSDPFHTAFSARLAFDDALSVVAFVALIYTAIVQRRRLWLHAGAMLATVFLALPPIVGRLFPLIPGFPGEQVTGLPTFVVAFELAQLVAIGGALWMARAYPRSATPFRAVAGVLVVESIAFETFTRTQAWLDLITPILSVPAAGLAAFGAAIGLAACWLAWQRPVGVVAARPATA